jgi:outer membrane protein TolC
MGTSSKRFRSGLFTISLLLFTSCATPPAKPLETGKLVDDVAGRAAADPKLVLAALALHDAATLGLSLPERWDPAQDAARDVFWHAHAIAFEPSVQASRRAWRAARHDADAAGHPDRTVVSYRLEDTGEPDRQNDIVSTLDLLGLLGIGPKAAERDVAARATGVALGQLEQDIWDAVFSVDRARVSLAASKRREARLASFAAEAATDIHRLETLYTRGRLSEGLIGRARAVHATFLARFHQHTAATARAREALAHASGLPPHALALDSIGAAMLWVHPTDPAPAPLAARLLDTVPALRAARLRYALAEAHLRAAAAAWWPSLRVGPHLKVRPDELLTGGILALDLPWPGKVSAQIEAAVERRERAREAVEGVLARTLASVSARRKELVIARTHYATHALTLASETAEAWRGARARLSVEDSGGAVDAWVDALTLRSRGVLAEVDALERVRLLELEFREAAGLRPGLDTEDDR